MQVSPGSGVPAGRTPATPPPTPPRADGKRTPEADGPQRTWGRRLRDAGSHLEVQVGALLLILLAVAVVAGIAAHGR